MLFKKRNINQYNNIGQKIKEARQKTGLSLKIIGKHINLNPKYLQAIEEENWSVLPGEIYTKNFLKRYCTFLKIDKKEYQNINLNNYYNKKNKQSNNNFRRKTKAKDFFNIPKTIKFLLIFFICASLFFYVIIEVKKITEPPKLNITFPKSDTTVSTSTIQIKGYTENNAEVKINQQKIILNKDNTFSEKIHLLPGINYIKIQADRKHSKTNQIQRKIIYNKE